MKYKYHLLLVVLSDAKIGLTHGKDLALVELGEETPPPLIEELVQKIGFDLSPSLKVYEDGDDDNDKDMKTPLMKKMRRKVIKGPEEV